MNRPLRGFLSVFTLISRVPVRLAFDPDFARADLWLPIIGLAAAAFGLAGFFVAQLLFAEPALIALAALAVQYLGFNLFHLDGLLDSADALAGQATPERRLEILKDSRIGSFAFFFGFLVLSAKVFALASLLRSSAAWAVATLIAAPVAGRTACAFVPLLARPVRPHGLGALMKDFSPLFLSLGWLIGSLPLVAFAFGPGSPALALAALASSIVAAAGAGLFTARVYKKRIGGFTGDAMGMAVELGELLCALLCLAAMARLTSG